MDIALNKVVSIFYIVFMEVTDEILISKYWKNTNMLYRKVKYGKVLPEEIEYLKTRFENVDNIYEAFYLIKHGLDGPLTCKLCGKRIPFINEIKSYGKRDGLKTYCSSYCQQHDPEKLQNMRQSIIDKYGVKSTLGIKEFIDKRKKTCQEKYGSNSILGNKEFRKKIPELIKNKYGETYLSDVQKERWSHISKEERNKMTEKKRQTFLKHYGVDNYAKTEEYKKFASSISKEVQKKGYLTMKKNGTLDKRNSKAEDECYDLLKEIYPDIIRQYYDNNRYPYKCDFYIPSKDLFVEYQGFYTHGEHPYNKNSIKDQVILERLKKKYKHWKKLPQIITTWTIKDVEKRECAKRNNLNYLEFFTINQVREYINRI